MKLSPFRATVLLGALVLTACTTTPSSPEQSTAATPAAKKTVEPAPPKPFTENPGDVKFDNPTADVMYELLVAELATQRGSPEIASRFYIDAAKTSKNPQVAARAVRIASFAESKEEALEAARIWVEADPENEEAQRVLAILLLRNEAFDEAKNVLANFINRDPEGLARNILLTGAMLQREASSEGAINIAAQLRDLYPDHAESHYIFASLSMQANQPEPALESIKRAIELKPDWVEAVILYPRILNENGKTEEAIQFLSDYVKANPNEDAVRLTYARILVDARKLEDARSQFELLAVKMPNNQDVLFALAMLSMQFKQYDEAESYLMQLNKLGKTNAQVIYYLGQIAEQKEKYEEAINWYAQLRAGDYYIESQLRIGVILAKTKSVDEARTHLQSIETKTEEESREVMLFEGNLLRDFKQYQTAFDYYTELLKQHKQDLELLYYRSLVAERLNMVDTVIEDLTYVIEKEPENAAALNALGYTLADRTDKLQEALKLIQRARDLEPDDPAIIDSLGWVNFRLGNNEAALKLLSEAMEKIDDGEVAAHYGEVLWHTGDKEKAISVWKKAKEKDGNNEILLRTMERFGQ